MAKDDKNTDPEKENLFGDNEDFGLPELNFEDMDDEDDLDLDFDSDESFLSDLDEDDLDLSDEDGLLNEEITDALEEADTDTNEVVFVEEESLEKPIDNDLSENNFDSPADELEISDDFDFGSDADTSEAFLEENSDSEKIVSEDVSNEDASNKDELEGVLDFGEDTSDSDDLEGVLDFGEDDSSDDLEGVLDFEEDNAGDDLEGVLDFGEDASDDLEGVLDFEEDTNVSDNSDNEPKLEVTDELVDFNEDSFEVSDDLEDSFDFDSDFDMSKETDDILPAGDISNTEIDKDQEEINKKNRSKFSKYVIFGIFGILLLGFGTWFIANKYSNKKKDLASKIAKSKKKKPAKKKKEKKPSVADVKKTDLVDEKKKSVAEKDNSNNTSTPGEITRLSSRSGKYHIIIGSFVDADMADDLAKKIAKKGQSPVIIPPFGNAITTRVGVASFGSLSDATNAVGNYQEYASDAWVLRY